MKERRIDDERDADLAEVRGQKVRALGLGRVGLTPFLPLSHFPDAPWAHSTGASNGKASRAKAAATNGATASNGAATADATVGSVTGGVAATAADATEAAALPKATGAHANPPSIVQVQTLASVQVQSALGTNEAVLDALGVDSKSLAQDAAATAEAGERTLRLFESAFRSAEDYHAKLTLLAPDVTSLSKALRKLDAKSPLRVAFAAFLQERDMARGIPTIKRTKQRNKRTKAKAAAASKGTTATS